MLSLDDVVRIMNEADDAGVLNASTREKWLQSCLAMVQLAEPDRQRVSEDGDDLDAFVSRLFAESCG